MSGRIGARAVLVAPLVVSGLLVSGCMSSPTYGTGKTANEQLATDVTSMFSLKPKTGLAREYEPRPELVKPATPTTELPPPQENIVTAAGGQWPESPEQKRARIRADATENRDKPGWEPESSTTSASEQAKSTAQARRVRAAMRTPASRAPASRGPEEAGRGVQAQACRVQAGQPDRAPHAERAAARISPAGRDRRRPTNSARTSSRSSAG